MPKFSTQICVAVACLLGVFPSGCGDDGPVEVSGTGGGDGGGGSESGSADESVTADGSDSADESGGAGGDGGGPPCGFEGMLGGPGDYELVAFPAVGTPGQHFDFVPQDDCDLPGIYDPGATQPDDPELNDNLTVTGFSVFVYHPQNGSGEWPAGLADRPAVFLAPANGTGVNLVANVGTNEADHRYRELIRTLVEAGFVVFGLQPEADSMNSGRRRSALGCMMNWARSEWDPGGRLSDYMVLMGHSRGGGAAYLLTEDLLDGENLPTPIEAPGLWQWRQCATTTFAQRYGESNNSQEFAVAPITHSEAPPFLSIVGASDTDTRPQGIRAYDGRFSESLAAEPDSNARDQFDEVVVVVHSRSHDAWGGFQSPAVSPLVDPMGPYYAEQFLRWQMMGEDASRRRFMDLVDADADACALDDLVFADASDCKDADPLTVCDWDGPTEAFYRGCTDATPPGECVENPDLIGLGRPLIRADFAQGEQAIGAARYVVDSLDHEGGACELTTPGPDLLLSSSGSRITVTSAVTADGPCVCALQHEELLGGYIGPNAPEACDPGSDLGPPFAGSPALGVTSHIAHEGGGMLVRFGAAFGPASVQWSLFPDAHEGDDGYALDVAAYTHLSVRVGNVVEGIAPESGDCAGDYAPDEFVVSAEIEDAGGGSSVRSLGRLVESDAVENNGCATTHFMQTIRVPIARYCAERQFDPYHATSITLHFEDLDQSHIALVDSIELVRDPAGAALVPTCSEEVLEDCPSAAPSGWNCEATNTLVAVESSCSSEPISGVCPSSSVHTAEVDLPIVDEEQPGEYYGWVAHIPRGWVRDPSDPTAAELDDITVRCVTACELEYADRPEIAANCSGTDAFGTPTLRTTDDRGPRVAIADARADGSGIFTGAALNCDLRDSCAAAFDEDLAIARPRRPTSMGEPLGRNQEWFVQVGGTVSADSPDAPNPVAVALEGTMGFSHCAGGNASASCPFYLGSLDLEITDPLTIALECDGSTEVHVLDSLSLRLAQPAMGIAPTNSQWRGFPEGALVFEAEGVVDGAPFHALGPARRDFKFIANNGWVQLQGAGGSYLELTMPCGDGTADVLAWLAMNTVGWSGTPPSVNITVPATVSCPSTRTLSKTLSDAQQDIESVRWRVDGVLLQDGVTSIPFTQAHTLQAVVRDSRGATYTKTKSIACQ